jgi:hypothetical protein
VRPRAGRQIGIEGRPAAERPVDRNRLLRTAGAADEGVAWMQVLVAPPPIYQKRLTVERHAAALRVERLTLTGTSW